jgi:hypothetical protein
VVWITLFDPATVVGGARAIAVTVVVAVEEMMKSEEKVKKPRTKPFLLRMKPAKTKIGLLEIE